MLVARRVTPPLWDVLGFADDAPETHGRNMDGVVVLGGVADVLERFHGQSIWFHCGIGRNSVRRKLSEMAESAGFRPATLIDPRAVVAESAEGGPGTYVAPHVFIGPQAKVGRHVLINVGSSVGHHASVGDYAQLCPGARLSGNVSLGASTFVGSNGVLAPGVSMGEGATLAASSFAARDVPAGALALGVPAKMLATPGKPACSCGHMNETRLKNCVSESLGVGIEQVTDLLAYNSVKQMDTVAHMALVAAVESEFNVMLDTDEIIALS
ncbi:MAG: acetyltransferase, partial [bacterium]|nr:acetyltransferase [bacterium]